MGELVTIKCHLHSGGNSAALFLRQQLNTVQTYKCTHKHTHTFVHNESITRRSERRDPNKSSKTANMLCATCARARAPMLRIHECRIRDSFRCRKCAHSFLLDLAAASVFAIAGCCWRCCCCCCMSMIYRTKCATS